MNIIEAIKSRKPFRRYSGWFNMSQPKNYLFITPEQACMVYSGRGYYYDSYNFTVEDLLAEDWIVKED